MMWVFSLSLSLGVWIMFMVVVVGWWLCYLGVALYRACMVVVCLFRYWYSACSVRGSIRLSRDT